MWIINHTFGLKAKRVLDPVFAADSEIFREIWESSEREMPGKPYLAAYILDPTPEKREALRYLSAKLELRWLLCWMESGILKRIKSRSICRAWQRILWWRTGWLTFADAVILLQIPVMERALRFCSKSPLSALETRKGKFPMDSLAHVFRLKDRFLGNPLDIRERSRLLRPPDYKKVRKILEAERRESRQWLADALEMPVLEKKDNLWQEPKGIRRYLEKGYRRYLRPCMRALRKK